MNCKTLFNCFTIFVLLTYLFFVLLLLELSRRKRNDKERERAFFGSALGPAQLITPPSLRILPASFKWMFDENEKILSSYYFWALFPFGRLARDVIGPQGIMSNPAFAVEKLTGFPLYRASRLYKKALEED